MVTRYSDSIAVGVGMWEEGAVAAAAALAAAAAALAAAVESRKWVQALGICLGTPYATVI